MSGLLQVDRTELEQGVARWERLGELLSDSARELGRASGSALAPAVRAPAERFLEQWSRLAQAGADEAASLSASLARVGMAFDQVDDQAAAGVAALGDLGQAHRVIERLGRVR